MPGRIVEVADNRRHLSMERGFLLVNSTGDEKELIGKIPLDDIDALIVNAHGISYTNNLLVALAERGAPFVLCARNFLPVGMLVPIDGNHLQAGRFDAQLSSSKPLSKRLWKCLVQAKITQQAAVLRVLDISDKPVTALIKKVRSGDPDNIEAQAARRYWKLLFDNDFRRDRNAEGLNALLNYGYTVLRSATARAVIAAGLHPSIGLHHSNKANAMRLVDDLMEPFRPVIDMKVAQLAQVGRQNIDSTAKHELVRCLYVDMESSDGRTPLTVCLQRLSISLAHVFLGEREQLDIPAPLSHELTFLDQT